MLNEKYRRRAINFSRVESGIAWLGRLDWAGAAEHLTTELLAPTPNEGTGADAPVPTLKLNKVANVAANMRRPRLASA